MRKKVSRYLGIPAQNTHRNLKLPYSYLQKAKKNIQIPRHTRTKRTSEPKITLFLPTKCKKSIQIPRHTRTKHTSEPKITLFLPTKIGKKVSRYLGIPAPNTHRNLKLPYFYLQNAKKSIQIPRHTRTKRTSEPKITLFLPTKSKK